MRQQSERERVIAWLVANHWQQLESFTMTQVNTIANLIVERELTSREAGNQ